MKHISFRIFFMMILVLSATTLWAESYHIKQMTPEVEAALESRRERYDQLSRLKASGAVGENNRGYVVAFSDAAAGVVSLENQDRRIIYSTIAQQNNLGGALETIEKVFAQVQRDKAQPGEKVQMDNGNWTP